ncbi:hypothetical protein pb186bvf_008482 [Paramecium bursaria]
MFQQFKDLVNKQVFKSESPKQGWDIDEDEPPIDENKEIIASIQQIQDMQMILEMEKQEFAEKHQQILQELEQERKVNQQYLEEEKQKLDQSRAEINKQQQFYEHAFKIKLDDGNSIDQLVNLNFKLTSDIQELEQFQQEQFQQYEDQIEIITKEKIHIQNKLNQLNHIIKQSLPKLKLDLKQLSSYFSSQWLNQFVVQIQVKFDDLKQILHQKEIEIRDLTFANDDMQVKLLEADEIREDCNQLGKIVTELKKSENNLMIELEEIRQNNQYQQSLFDQKNLEIALFELEEQIETIREEKIELKIELDNQKKLVKQLEEKLAEHSQVDNDELIDQIETKFEKKIYELYQQIDQKNNQIEELNSIHQNEINAQLQHYQRIVKEYEGKLNLSIYKEHVQEEQLQQLQMCLVDSEFQANFNQQILQEKIEKLEHEQHKEEEEKAIPEIADGGWQIEDENIDEPFEEEINNDFEDDSSSKKQSGERKQESFEFRQGLVDNQWGIDFQDEPEENQQEAFKNFEDDEFEEGKQYEELDKPIQKHQDPILEQKIDFIINNHQQELQFERQVQQELQQELQQENQQEWQNQDQFMDNQENDVLEQDNKELVAEVNNYIEQQNKITDYQYIKENQQLQIVVEVKKNISEWDLEDENDDQFGEESPIKQQQSDIFQNESESQIMLEVQKQLSDDFQMLDSNIIQNIQSELNIGFCNSNPKSMEINQEALKEDSIQGQLSEKLLDESILQEDKDIQDQNGNVQDQNELQNKDVQQDDMVVSQYQEEMTIQRNQQLQDENEQNEIVNYDNEQNSSTNQMLESEIIQDENFKQSQNLKINKNNDQEVINPDKQLFVSDEDVSQESQQEQDNEFENDDENFKLDIEEENQEFQQQNESEKESGDNEVPQQDLNKQNEQDLQSNDAQGNFESQGEIPKDEFNPENINHTQEEQNNLEHQKEEIQSSQENKIDSQQIEQSQKEVDEKEVNDEKEVDKKEVEENPIHNNQEPEEQVSLDEINSIGGWDAPQDQDLEQQEEKHQDNQIVDNLQKLTKGFQGWDIDDPFD